ncbi:hypothetical protein SAMN05660284_01600 [Formivibrio citricus]|uniref:Uncharacterized protein n=1 Tax=Formivibrio citricus TaxID=83765 RepID=A0A1I4ZDT4_9NEIS|nr:hypothetical protein [Formivibrio citricus]SFN48435.1 hypothetical protein SAMN05660284_01600 [Formivibrio citricus]
MKYTIENESEAFLLLEDALGGKIGMDALELDFKGWPVVNIRVCGEGYDSTITPEMANAIIELQHAIHRSYARIVHNKSNARCLNGTEKDQLRLKVKVQKGSTNLPVDLTEYLKTVTTQVIDKVTPEQVVTMVVSIALIAGGCWAYKAFLNARVREKEVDAETHKAIALSEQETKRSEIMAKALSRDERLLHVKSDFDQARNEILKGTADAKMIQVGDLTLSGESARKLAHSARAESIDVQLNGNYIIIEVHHSHPDEVRLKLNRCSDGKEFYAKFRDASLDQEQIKILQRAEWDRSKVYLSINATELRGEVTTATVVSVTLQP